jgi:outer membrane protein OmpA-like peptidoglycan-associated protein/tetratricopeptide (TPR) repeat protein
MARAFSFMWVILLPPLFSFGQTALSTQSKKAIELYTVADNYRVRGQYKEAIELLTDALSRDKQFVEAYFRLGQTYKSCKQYSKAIDNFQKGLTINADAKKQKPFWYELGESQFLIGNYDEAQILLTKYVEAELPSVQNKSRIDNAKKMLENVAFAKQNLETRAAFQQRPLSDTVNSFAMQYFPVLTADNQSIIFTRRLGDGNNDDEDIVISTKDAKGRWTQPISVSDKINSTLNEGTSTISADGRKLIFTSCVGRNGWGSCDLYESHKVGAEWSEPRNLGPTINTHDWESQPSLSADGRTLYFVSDRRGGQGRRDIWFSTLDAGGNWTKSRNLGAPVNSAYDEISPFIHVNNQTLYFACNGRAGFGGYDIFYVERDPKANWTQPVNVGSPINTHEDQFSLFITAAGNKAYYSHEEVDENGKTRSKIMETLIPETQRIKRSSNYVRGIVRDKETKSPLFASIELIDIESDTLLSLTQSDSVTGEYLMVLTQGARYALYINKEKYIFKSISFDYSTEQNAEPVVMDVELERIKAGSVTVLNNIFFEFDKHELDESSIPELEKVVRFLQENPAVSVEISGHTDTIGAIEYNLELSKKRALSIVRYLTSKGIPQKRVSSVGLGSSKPLTLDDSPELQKINRRIEFRIL